MARKIKLKRPEFQVYLDDVENPNYGKPDKTTGQKDDDATICQAVEINPGDRPPGDVTLFTLRQPPFDLRMEIGSGARGDGPGAVYRVLSRCLVGWENFEDENGNKVNFSPKKIALLPDEEGLALATYLMQRFSRSEDAKEALEQGNVS